MAGGKETPRQKMIGMMYLVLTALLALNVSKSILEAFVSMDNNIQAGTRSIQARGNEAFADLELVKTDAESKGEKARAEAAQEWLDKATKIRELTAAQIEVIHGIKDELIQQVGSELGKVKVTDEAGNVVYDCAQIDAKDNYDVPMTLMIGPGADIKSPSESAKGMELWNSLIAYRDNLVTELATYKKNTLDASKLPGEGDWTEDMLSTVNKEDRAVVKAIYMQLTKQERADTHGGENKDIHWVGRTFDHAPVVAALAQLSSLEQDIRTAESNALAHIRTKVGGSDYSFNKVQALAYSPSNYYNSGDSVEVQVFMAAYDSYNQPIVTYADKKEGKDVEVKDVKEGKGYLRFRAVASDTLKGVLKVKKKDGSLQPLDWKFPYTVGSPSGVVSLPEMFTLYKGYQNKVIGAVTGYTDYRLSMTGGSISRSGKEWIASPAQGVRKATISITGIAPDGSSAALGKFDFDVRQMPSPNIYIGKKTNGETATKAEIMQGIGKLFARYDESIPLKASFSITKWEVYVEGARAPVRGTGANASAAGALVRGSAKGGVVAVKAWVKYPSGLVKPLMSSVTVQ
ncbi:MAG: GldM family protein [Crocinitomicaceae bacterium]